MKAFGLFALASGALALPRNFARDTIPGLNQEDYTILASKIKFNPGTVNMKSSNGGIWIGNDGPNTFTFEHAAPDQSMTVIAWLDKSAPGGGSFLTAASPAIAYSLNKGEKITVSLASGVSGGFSSVYHGTANFLNGAGMVNNTWGEFTTGAGPSQPADIDVSREPNMDGKWLAINTNSEHNCYAEYSDKAYQCVFECTSFDNPWGEPMCQNPYRLANCKAANNPDANTGRDDRNKDSGGCQGGWTHADVQFL